MPATQIFRNRIAVLFDFDLTLAPDTFSRLLRECGIADPEAWRNEHVQPLVDDGWEQILARVWSLVRLSNARKTPCVTAGLMRRTGQSIEPYEGVPEMFGTLRRHAAEVLPGLEVEFYLLTSGFLDMQRAAPFAGEFREMWGTEFHYDGNGGIAFPRRIVTHPEKSRYILQLSKGTGTGGPNAPADVHQDVPDEQMHIPLDQVIYVGDGGSDMAAFALLHQHGGIALAVYKSEQAQDWSGQEDMRTRRRVQNLAPADFRPGSELMQSLILAVESIGKRVALRKLGAGE